VLIHNFFGDLLGPVPQVRILIFDVPQEEDDSVRVRRLGYYSVDPVWLPGEVVFGTHINK
jgi:hypothetical protein